ncbi:RNA-dependent RNA polymerase [Beihai weivirus-like virus 9]|uniref:RNA-dependent RNA polymerase n=1 Tax=Beihai weivirus-like virus 9 TaxID=1922756 RepID=UPI00090B0F70|nr:RNA-dependent RNA polymerase [Beihai weivirus-like virus 9]APG78126.1 RNA-dependent RNA polymerase [Beihai weivirus-like virus 9]
MTLPLSVANTTSLRDIEGWMFKIASERPGMYTIRVRLPQRRCGSCIKLTRSPLDDMEEVVVHITGEEFAKLDKVIMNQSYSESKPKVQAAIIYQHASTIWPSHTPDDVTMRTLGAWAITQYRCNGGWAKRLLKCIPCLQYMQKEVHLDLKGLRMPNRPVPPTPVESEESSAGGTNGSTVRTNTTATTAELSSQPTVESLPTITEHSDEEDENARANETPGEAWARWLAAGPPRNEIGYVELGHGNEDLHPLGGASAEDSAIRAERQDRVLENAAGVGVVGQSTQSENAKQIVGVVSLPMSEPPNVYAKEAENIQAAIDQRITRKQRAFTANKEDKILLGRLVSEAIGNDPRRSLFSTRRVTEWWETHLFGDLKSGKWTEERLSRTIEGLCQRINPKFKLSCDIKLEPMPEGKPPRMLIADGDEGQVLALLTICCIEDLIKKHLPKKTIKGLGKRQAMERVAQELRAPKAAYAKTRSAAKSGQYTGFSKMVPPGVTVFEGDGSAWDTTCSASLRDCVENPVIVHVASILKVHMVQPEGWVDAHTEISKMEKLLIIFKKNGEFRKYIIDAIRRSGHRGTSCLNWWTNFVCWHCAIFEKPEIFLDPDVRYGLDHSGVWRWIATAFEGDDSILSTTPRIDVKSEIYVSIMQRWERLGFNMEIFIREERAKFTGYYMALDNDGTTGVLMPEVDRCFARSGVSCSPSMIECFKKEDRTGCQSISRAAALSRAYEFAGLSPTISTKYLRFYESMSVSTKVDRDLKMRTCGGDAEFSEKEIVAEINLKNGGAMSFDSSERDRLAAVGFKCTEEELSRFALRMWDYDLLKDWDGFRESLPESWRMA